MNNYQIISTGTPIYPYKIGIQAPINVSQTLTNSITVPYATNTQEFTDALVAYTSNAENAYKTLPEFTTRDSNKNGTYTYANTGGITYDIVMSWTIKNAVIGLEANTTTDLQGTDLENLLQSLADSKVAEVKSQWEWIDL
jgi:hypothetical protein